MNLNLNVTCNDGRNLFVIESTGGFTTYGYENCFKDSFQLAKRLGRLDLLPNLSEIGTLKQYQNYQRLINGVNGKDIGTWFVPGTKLEVIRALSAAIEHSWNVRIWYGDEDGRSWMDEYEMSGRVSRSMGALKVPLLMIGKSCHGSAILTDRVIKISRIIGSGSSSRIEDIWKQKNFNLPKMEIKKGDLKDWPFEVLCDGSVHARFKTVEKTQKWIDFMNGLIAKP